jgi:hypothetical protein
MTKIDVWIFMNGKFIVSIQTARTKQVLFVNQDPMPVWRIYIVKQEQLDLWVAANSLMEFGDAFE